MVLRLPLDSQPLLASPNLELEIVLTKTAFEVTTVTCSQTRLLAFFIFAGLLVGNAPTTAWLATVAFALTYLTFEQVR